MSAVDRFPAYSAAYKVGAATLVAAAGIILGALAFEYIGGYAPCPLCLQQRYAYYAGIPLLFVALILVTMRRRRAPAILFALVAIGFLANAGLATYHAGVEWKLWEGPQTCQAALAPLGGGPGGLLKQLETERLIRCDEAPWEFAGLSLAGWNAIFSLLLAFAAAHAASLSWRRA